MDRPLLIYLAETARTVSTLSLQKIQRKPRPPGATFVKGIGRNCKLRIKKPVGSVLSVSVNGFRPFVNRWSRTPDAEEARLREESLRGQGCLYVDEAMSIVTQGSLLFVRAAETA
ncbi:MAG TPA: hypothetical protein VK036_05020 [Wenzhouxiangella sp.]|nr:hypothetical protein [Wenzhouxiangella sp.]